VVARIYTRTGDSGETGLFDGTRVSKADARIEACGAVDELTAWLGLARAGGIDADLDEMIVAIQSRLFALGAHIADPRHRIADRVAKTNLGEDDITRLEQWIDRLEFDLPKLDHFILAGGRQTGASLHLARTVCRRAERRIVALGTGAVEAIVITYVNRLSDLLFVMARSVNHRAGVSEIEW
jgi:cob(I)alamin adenosyltransferase